MSNKLPPPFPAVHIKAAGNKIPKCTMLDLIINSVSFITKHSFQLLVTLCNNLFITSTHTQRELSPLPLSGRLYVHHIIVLSHCYPFNHVKTGTTKQKEAIPTIKTGQSGTLMTLCNL